MEKWKQEIAKIKNAIAEADKNLKEKARVERYKQLAVETDQLLKAFQSEKAQKIRDLELDVMGSKLTASIEESKEEKREITAESVSISNFLTKTVLSKIYAESANTQGYLGIVQKLANDDDENMRQLLLDSYHEIYSAGNQLFGDDFKKISDQVNEAYRKAQNSFKSLTQLHYEEKLSKLSNEKFNINFNSQFVETEIEDTKNDLYRQLHFMDDYEESNGLFN